VVAQLGEQAGNIGALGIGLPGMVDSVNGIVHHLTNVPGWQDVALRQLLQERTALPTTIENDANAMAYGEWKYGAAKNARHAICITLGTGVGGALILDGRLYRGAQLGAGEVGHLSIDYNGIPWHVREPRRARELRGEFAHRQTGRASLPRDGQPTHRRGVHAAGPGALRPRRATRSRWAVGGIGTEIGAALASVVWVLNPDTIVIGGGVAKAGDLLFNPIRRIIASASVDVFHENLRVVAAALGNDAGIIGNAALALDAV
jgi:glucokinase